MAVTSTQPAQDAVRRRKAHKKSRQGCNNCKLRRVKCDEAKPKCNKCLDYGVDCSYESRPNEDSQLSVAGEFTFDIPRTTMVKAPSANKASLDMINNCLVSKYADTPIPAWRLSAADLETLDRFQTRTVRTIGTAQMHPIYKQEIIRLASCNPFLMHVVLTLTLMHDRYEAKGTKLSVAEAFHWYQGTALFNHVLSKPIKREDRDAIWASASFLGAIAFSAVEAASPEDAWPLKPPSDDDDLDWLGMTDGKKEIARIAYPNGPDSVFYTITGIGFVNLLDSIPDWNSRFEFFEPGFIEYYALDQMLGPERNPYHKPAAMLNVLLSQECNWTTILQYFTFLAHIPPEFKTLLREKDPRALLLLAFWYGKLCEYNQWWVFKRALVECQSICVYLRRYHWQNMTLTKLLKYPISRCGLEGSKLTAVKHWMFPTD